jgi:signal transduction histidine kinase
VYPEHDADVCFPITYIEPVASNLAAVGLDIAHESNRLTAALKARDSGTSQITGPIVLVQDSGRTPGFLFYAPVYAKSGIESNRYGRGAFLGMVYAPFVVKNLMEGVLDKQNRHVGIRVCDGDVHLYDELVESEPDYDPNPQFTATETVEMYGREWRFDVRSGLSFRAAQSSSQPMFILLAGLGVEAMLIGLFVLLSRANRRALSLADLATQELQDRNRELEQFVYTASHDLKSPLLTIQGFVGIMRSDLAEGRHDRLEHSRVGRVAKGAEWVDLGGAVSDALSQVDAQLSHAGAEVTVEPGLPSVLCDRDRLVQVLLNLIGNAVRYGSRGASPPRITIGGRSNGREVEVFVADNGPGVPEEFRDRVFGLFERLHTDVEGTGIGLAIVRRVAEVHGGRAWVEESVGGGATFVVSFPSIAQDALKRDAA